MTLTPYMIVFPFTLPGRNELDDSQRRFTIGRSGFRVPAYAEVRADWLSVLANYAERSAPGPVPAGRLLVGCRWYEPDRHRDPDNVVSGGRKLILDAIGPGRPGPRGWRGAGLLHCDGWHCIAGFSGDEFAVSKAPRVEITLTPIGVSP